MRLCILIPVVCALTAFGSAQPEPGFDSNEVVRQVHTRGGQGDFVPSHPTTQGRRRPMAADGRLGGGPEFLIDTNSTLVPAPGNQSYPALASDGANSLVVWQDRRSGSPSSICGSRVTPQGTVLDTSGFVISQGADDRLHPVLRFDGTNFLVVWQEYSRGSFTFDIWGARVTPTGTVLDTSGFVISQGADDQSSPALGFDGSNFLVVWQDGRNDPEEPDIYGARVTPGGAVLDSGFVICQAAGGQYDPVLDFGGTNFFVVWHDWRDSGDADIYGTLVTPQGVVIVPDGYAISHAADDQAYPAIGFDGENFLVAWQDCYGSFPPELSIYGARVTPGGTVLDPEGIAISRAPGEQMYPALGSVGENFLVVWPDCRGGGNSDIYGARVTPEGTVLDPQGIAISQAAGAQGFPALGSDGANFLVVWQDRRGGGSSDIYGARVTPEGTVSDPDGFVIPQAARDQLTPAVDFDSENFLVVWEDHRSGIDSDIYGARVTPEGTVLDPDGIAVSEAAGWQYSPAVGFDGANFLVVWEDHRSDSSDIWGARVTPEGTVLETDGIVISAAPSGQCSPAIGFDGANSLVVWQDHRNGSNFDIYGTRVTPGGTVLDPGGIVISAAPGGQSSPAVGFDGANYLVAWADYRNGDYPDIYGAWVTPQGTVPDPQGFVISPAKRGQSGPVLGFDGANYLVAWTDYRSGIYSDIFGARVTPAGAVLDPSGISIARAAEGQYGPALSLGFDGTNFLVVWEDYRSNCPDIYGALVSPAGVASDTGVVVGQEGNQSCPALALGTDSELFLVYQGWAGTVEGKTYNTYRIWGKTNPATGGVEDGPQPTAHSLRPIPTILRGMLFLAEAPGHKLQAASLLDISGRKVMDLKPGANDVRALAPGVYFVRSAGDEGRTLKVVLQR